MKTVPIVYIHKGYSWYLPIALQNGVQFHDRENVWLLGDPFANAIAKKLGVNTALISDFMEGAHAFEKDYVHESSLGVAFELFCIQRWFILLEFMQSRNLNTCIHLDSDILLTQTLELYRQQLQEWPMTFTGYSAHINFINDRAGLEQFCSFVKTFYRDPSNATKRAKWRQEIQRTSGSGGVSDMTLFYWFKEAFPRMIGDYRSIFGDSPFDVSLENVEGFVKEKNGFKKLFWKKEVPYAVKKDGSHVELACLHHQGPTKKLLSAHAIRLHQNPLMIWLVFPLLGLFYKALAKFRYFH